MKTIASIPFSLNTACKKKIEFGKKTLTVIRHTVNNKRAQGLYEQFDIQQTPVLHSIEAGTLYTYDIESYKRVQHTLCLCLKNVAISQSQLMAEYLSWTRCLLLTKNRLMKKADMLVLKEFSGLC